MRSDAVSALFTVSLAFSLALAATAVNAQDSGNASITPSISNLNLKAGESFLKARARIIKQGWKPIRMHRSDNYEYSGTEKDLADRGIREVDSCSMDAGVLCILYYSKANECLRLETHGEQVNHIRLRLWLKECPTEALQSRSTPARYGFLKLTPFHETSVIAKRHKLLI